VRRHIPRQVASNQYLRVSITRRQCCFLLFSERPRMESCESNLKMCARSNPLTRARAIASKQGTNQTKKKSRTHQETTQRNHLENRQLTQGSRSGTKWNQVEPSGTKQNQADSNEAERNRRDTKKKEKKKQKRESRETRERVQRDQRESPERPERESRETRERVQRDQREREREREKERKREKKRGGWTSGNGTQTQRLCSLGYTRHSYQRSTDNVARRIIRL